MKNERAYSPDIDVNLHSGDDNIVNSGVGLPNVFGLSAVAEYLYAGWVLAIFSNSFNVDLPMNRAFILLGESLGLNLDASPEFALKQIQDKIVGGGVDKERPTV